MDIALTHPLPANARLISQQFGENPDYYAQWQLAGHNGIDFAVPEGTPVAAAHTGRCWLANDPRGYGQHIVLASDDGRYQTLYAHLSGFIATPSEHVQAGQVIGVSGDTGNSTGPHLHFGVKIPGANPPYRDWVDPSPYLPIDQIAA